MAIANSTVRVDIWNTLYTGLTNALGTAYTVTAAYIDNPKTSFVDQVVLNPIEVNDEPYALGTTVFKNEPVNVVIDIYSKKNLTIDEASDLINDYFITNEGTLDGEGLHNMNYFDNPAGDIIDLRGQKLHVKTIGVEFQRDRK